jgi:uncharacterized membrane protein YGL010W
MRTITQWLDDYQSSHQNPRNKTLHWIGITTIVFSIFGILATLPLGPVNAAAVLALGALAYYAALSWRLTLGMALVYLAYYAGATTLHAQLGGAMLPAMGGLFVFGWVLQFWGHQIEGAKPSFFEDLQFLMIGPLWLLADVYRRAGIRY